MAKKPIDFKTVYNNVNGVFKHIKSKDLDKEQAEFRDKLVKLCYDVIMEFDSEELDELNKMLSK